MWIYFDGIFFILKSESFFILYEMKNNLFIKSNTNSKSKNILKIENVHKKKIRWIFLLLECVDSTSTHLRYFDGYQWSYLVGMESLSIIFPWHVWHSVFFYGFQQTNFFAISHEMATVFATTIITQQTQITMESLWF